MRAGAIEVLEPKSARRLEDARAGKQALEKIQAQQFVVSVEIDPPKGVSIDRIVEQVGRVMADGHVDCD